MAEDELRGNAILAALPESELRSLSRSAEVVDAEIRRQVYNPGTPITEVYFPIASVFSMVGMDADRVVVEVDVYIPGCPPDADAIAYVFEEILAGRVPKVPSEMMRYD